MTNPEQYAVVDHAAGDYAASLSQRLAVLHDMELGDPARGPLMSAIALTYERAGDSDSAVGYAHGALNTVERERKELTLDAYSRSDNPALFINAGTVLLRQAARRRVQGFAHNSVHVSAHANIALTAAGSIIRRQRREGEISRLRPHQHTINLLSRLAMSEVSYADPGPRVIARSFMRAAGGTVLGLFSEMPQYTFARTPDMPRGVRTRAKLKAMGRGLAAMGVVAASIPRLPVTNRLRDKLILRAA